MGCLAWLLAMIGVGGAALGLAVGAPGQAWWILSLIVIALLAGPHVLQRWRARSRRTERLAAAWWATAPDPVEVAFLCGGPDRVIDLVVADLVDEGRLIVDGEGRLTADGEGRLTADGEGQLTADGEGRLTADGEGRLGPAGAGADDDGFRREIHNRLSYGHADLPALRFSARPVTEIASLWRTAVRHGLLLPGWRREYTPWYQAGAVVAVGYCAAIALGQLPGTDLAGKNLTFVVALIAIGLGVVALWRPRFLVGYEFDPRTAAGLRAAQLARDAERPGDRRHRVAAHGIRAMRELHASAPGWARIPSSAWHVPWYARRVHEPETPWWHDVAQATTNNAAALGEAHLADDSHDDTSH
jgi:hypothetical protein